MNPVLFLWLALLMWLTVLKPIYGQSIIFEASFDNTLQSAEGESPANTANMGFTNGLQQAGILAEAGAILKYSTTDNMLAHEGGITAWIKPNWVPGDTLRRIVVVESNPVFELHVDESASLVFAMFSNQIESRVVAGNVGGWNKGDWHFIGASWSQHQIEIFVDGIRIAELSVGFEIPAFEGGVFNVGSLGGEDSFNGIIDELKIYDAPLSEAEISQAYDMALGDIPNASAIRMYDLFGRDVTQSGISLVDWEGPVRNPAMKYSLQGNDSVSYPLSIRLSTEVENSSFSLPSTTSSGGATKAIRLDSQEDLESFLFSFYMDENYEDESFDLTLTYSIAGLPVQQLIPVTVIDQDRDRPLSYPVMVDFSEAVHPVMVDPKAQDLIRQAAQDWLYYIEGEGVDEIPAGESFLVAGGQDHLFEEKTVFNPDPYTGYYLFAYGNTNAGPCVCSTGAPNRELLQTKNGEVLPIFRIGALHLNVFGQAFETEPTGWEVVSPYENWTLEGYQGTDMYMLAKHEIGHAMVFENSPLFLKAQGRDPNNPFPDESITPTPNGFTSPALTAYYPDEVVPLFPNSLSHVIDVLDPASQTPPYGGGVPEPVMPGGREMLTKLDILIMESVGYPLRENEVTKAVSVDSENTFRGEMGVEFEASLRAEGGIPVYDYTLVSGSFPQGISLDRRTGKVSGIPREEGEFPVSFQVKDYDERSEGATFTTTIRIGVPLSSAAELISFAFDSTLSIVETAIDSSELIISFTAAQGTDITSLIPLISISENATLSPAADEAQDFTNPVVYTITSEDGSVSKTWTIIIDLAVSIKEQLNQRVLVYPNPANQTLIVEMRELGVPPFELQVYNMQGQLVSHQQLTELKGHIALMDLAEGIYFLRVQAPSGNASIHQVVVEHE